MTAQQIAVGTTIMLGILFWNVRGHNLAVSVARLAALHGVDLIVLAERNKRHAYSSSLSKVTGRKFGVHNVPGCTYLHVLTALTPPSLDTVEGDVRHAILRIHRPPRPELLLALAHLPPKGPGPNSTENQRSVAEDFHQRIQFQENAAGHRRTIVLGDLNMDPFETGIISSRGLHAVSSLQIAARGTRTVNRKQSSPIFLNPMWRQWDDGVLRPPGSYYKACSLSDCLFWHMWDQVLVRREAESLFDHAALRILTGDGQDQFRSVNGLPKGKSFSDHLPIFLKVDV